MAERLRHIVYDKEFKISKKIIPKFKFVSLKSHSAWENPNVYLSKCTDVVLYTCIQLKLSKIILY